MIKDEIIGYLKQLIKENVPIEVFVPDNEKFGHYSTNVAFQLSKTLKKSPLETANSINEELKIKNAVPTGRQAELFEKTEVASPGFINFWLKPEVFQKETGEILKQKEKYGSHTAAGKESKKINLEFISANPTGELTIGNGRGAFLGDALANILELVGHKITKEYYINDARASNQIKKLGETALGKGETYKTLYLEQKVKGIKKELEGKSEGEAGYLLAQEVIKDTKNFIEKELKIKFDVWFSEEQLYQTSEIEELKKQLEKKGLVYEKEGALWFKSTEFGDTEDRVLIRSTGEPTYFITDLTYQLDKFVDKKFSQAIDIWGADHHGYESRLRGGLKALGILKNDDDFKIIITQMVRLIKDGKEVRMSKRAGDYFTLKELIEEIGLDAARFFFLMYSPDTHMDFDLGLAKEKSVKNPVYYVQYAAVRCQSIINKLQTTNYKPQTANFNLLDTQEDLNLMRMLARFPEEIMKAAVNYSPQIIVRYSMDLAREFNNFYEKEKVSVEDEKLASARLALIQATLTVFKNIFTILGISLPEKM
ncbi:MAG: arginine--tRNA ligase [Candidatus Paceibacterota bacterium]|jgi:arginyl-tRNA synthetase